MESAHATAIATEIMDLYEKFGGENYSGERVTQLEHMVQAAQLADEQGFDSEVILAAFLHDVGHISAPAHDDNEMDGYGIRDHEAIGAAFLAAKGFSPKVSKLVASHVAAKRYLTRRDPVYYDQLSEASKRTLEFQGGRMSEEEADAFEKDPLFEEIIQMRRWDEQAKIENKPLPDLQQYKILMIDHLTNKGQ